MKSFLTASLLLLVSACSQPAKVSVAEIPDGYKLFKAREAFQFYGPPDLQYVPMQGIDSFVGAFRNTNYSLEFDAGHYSSSLSEIDGLKSLHTINGNQALIVKSTDGIGINFPLVRGTENYHTGLTICVRCDKKYFDEIEKIFNTISFPD